MTDHWIDLEASAMDGQCPLEIEMTGDTYACTMGYPNGEFSSIVQNGSGSATTSYNWFEDGVLRGTSADYSLHDLSEGTREVALEVTRGDETDHDVRWVPVRYDPDGENGCEL